MIRPKWMPPENWEKFVSRWQTESGVITCAHPGCSVTQDLATDHIQSRFRDGTNEVDNLQPMCSRHNSSKGPRADLYWQRMHYFDGDLDRSRLRVSQNDFVVQAILDYEEEFAKPYSSFNGKLFSFFQIVGAGKTIGMFSLPFALNRAKRVHAPNTPRVDRALIITKDATLRAQIAEEIRSEPVEFGVTRTPPRVLEIDKGNKLTASEDSHNYDFAVMCPHMLWPNVDEDENRETITTWHPSIERIIARYPLIMFDEMHYAHERIRHLLRNASHSLIFGFTASPITGAGHLLDDMVSMSVYGYEEAVRNDNSMKSLGREAERILDNC